MWSEERLAPMVGRGRELLAQGRDINEVIALAHDDGFPFIQCVRLLTRLGVNLAEAKPLVHNNPAYADSRQDREDFWQEVAEGVSELIEQGDARPAKATDVQQISTATDDAKPDRQKPHDTV